MSRQTNARWGTCSVFGNFKEKEYSKRETLLENVSRRPSLQKVQGWTRKRFAVNQSCMCTDPITNLSFFDQTLWRQANVLGQFVCSLPFQIAIGGVVAPHTNLVVPWIALAFHNVQLRISLPAKREHWPDHVVFLSRCIELGTDERNLLMTTTVQSGDLLCVHGMGVLQMTFISGNARHFCV
jgi:hypothetical protein